MIVRWQISKVGQRSDRPRREAAISGTDMATAADYGQWLTVSRSARVADLHLGLHLVHPRRSCAWF